MATDKIVWGFCYEEGWISWLLAWVLLYPYIVWGGFFVCAWVLRSPLLFYITKFISPVTMIICYGLREMIRMPRAPLQDCENNFGLPDTRVVVGMVNVLTVLTVAVSQRQQVSLLTLVPILFFTVLYWFALLYNHYLSVLQLLFTLGIAFAFVGFWTSFYCVIAHANMIQAGFKV